MDSGLVLAFDLDNTLIDSRGVLKQRDSNWETIEQYIRDNLNLTIVEKILRPAIRLREEGKVSAILLITNNMLTTYADCVEYYIARHFGMLYGNVFDYMMLRQDPMRALPRNNPPKRLLDIQNCLVKIGKSVDNLAKRTFFFDDSHLHQIKKDFIKEGCSENYIHVKGPVSTFYPEYGMINNGFIAGMLDLTDYEPIIEAFKFPVELNDIIPYLLEYNSEISTIYLDGISPCV
jgi:hypothetical protein